MSTRKIAIPVYENKLADHFNSCQQMDIFRVSGTNIIQKNKIEICKGQFTKLPAVIYKNGVDVVLAGRIEQESIDALSRLGITVLSGAKPATSDAIIEDYLKGKFDKVPPLPIT